MGGSPFNAKAIWRVDPFTHGWTCIIYIPNDQQPWIRMPYVVLRLVYQYENRRLAVLSIYGENPFVTGTIFTVNLHNNSNTLLIHDVNYPCFAAYHHIDPEMWDHPDQYNSFPPCGDINHHYVLKQSHWDNTLYHQCLICGKDVLLIPPPVSIIGGLPITIQGNNGQSIVSLSSSSSSSSGATTITTDTDTHTHNSDQDQDQDRDQDICSPVPRDPTPLDLGQ